MIASLRGTVSYTAADSVVLEVAGVGYLVAVTPEVVRTAHLGDELHLHTTLIVRDDSLSLVGFPTREELAVFSALVAVSGVGPKSALGVLAALTVPQIADAVAQEDDAPFRRVSGIGPKTAKLIVVQLAGRLAVAPAGGNAAAEAPAQLDGQVVQALVGLGWPERVAADAVAAVAEGAPDAERTVSGLLRRALAHLGPAKAGAGRG
ncbi:Holliday junction branch migration protein RuvA [Microbacterium sp. SORGH_AS_0888]|uniref:Holliday junction branch migration protein RuvA n=1 Tax=Microbacterium sp. SORGH_AS_0888 TaxID=3041791 RepID=UPI002780EAC9|nr:Holliday junction branch migration protein RuvA [Microbacterium sp. SORGH_AS_0888]MDQ1128546.1 Holliday junction DNA helicase RuvA [Microbacterium sp. SORGH_AS_0888]